MQDLKSRLAVDTDDLRRRLDPASLPFETTAEVAPSTETIGQPRATSALTFGLEIESNGYNVFVAGISGSGRESTVLDALHAFAPSVEPPCDWVYVFNFGDPDHPNAIPVPMGRGNELSSDMLEFVDTVRQELTRAFESEEYERQRRTLLEEVGTQRAAIFEQLAGAARSQNYGIEMTPSGIVHFPLYDGKPMPQEHFAQLTPEERAAIEATGRAVQEQIVSSMRQVRNIDRDAASRLGQLDRAVTIFAIDPLYLELREKYEDQTEVLDHIEHVRNDILEHYRSFLQVPAQAVPAPQQVPGVPDPADVLSRLMARYEVNVIVDNGSTSGAPVIVERNPTYYNLVGRIDFRVVGGMVSTDFRQIKPGALHQANGGYLVLHADDILRQPFAWDALKRSLGGREIRIENMGEQQSLAPAASLRPDPIPLDVKVILIGSIAIYRLLYALDEDFEGLFKVKAEFSPDMPWTDQYIDRYLAFISRYVRDKNLRHLDRGAAARVIEYGARLRDHQQKLSVRMIDIATILTEASHWAGKNGHEIVQAEEIDTAIRLKEYRSNLPEERLHEIIVDGTIDIDVTGGRVGQVNGVAILNVGDYIFGRPSRISARVSTGSGKIQSIEREIKLSGPFHSKGFMILTGYLSGKYAQRMPLSVDATIAFEQSYNEVDGDSASSAELYALLSALSEVPLSQGIAVTGAVDQEGKVHAVGGVTRKVEGFFEVCKSFGLNGEQGIIIPNSNVKNLMLSDDVVDAVSEGKFTIWAVSSIDEGIEILTGQPAGERQADGTFPPASVHGRVANSLSGYAETVRYFSSAPNGVAHEATDGKPVSVS